MFKKRLKKYEIITVKCNEGEQNALMEIYQSEGCEMCGGVLIYRWKQDTSNYLVIPLRKEITKNYSTKALEEKLKQYYQTKFDNIGI